MSVAQREDGRTEWRLIPTDDLTDAYISGNNNRRMQIKKGKDEGHKGLE